MFKECFGLVVLVLNVMHLLKADWIQGKDGDFASMKVKNSFYKSSDKFHQDGYKIIHDRIELQDYNKDVVSHTNLFCYWYNRTTRAINFTMTLKRDIKEMKIAVQLYKFMSNEYRYFPLALEFNFCSALEQDLFDASSLRKCGNLYTNCKYLKGQTYAFGNWVPDESKFPPYIPGGKYKLNITLLTGSTMIGKYGWHGAIEEKMKWQ